MSTASLNPAHEKHGAGYAEEVPHISSPEEWVDRNTHDRAAHFCFLIEQKMLEVDVTIIDPDQYLELDIDMAINGRVKDLVIRRYKDVGWKTVTITDVVEPRPGQPDHNSSRVILQFP